jgi:hypothetical protein
MLDPDPDSMNPDLKHIHLFCHNSQGFLLVFHFSEKVAEKEARQDEMRARNEVLRIERIRRQRAREEAGGDTKADQWECNCRARHAFRGLRRSRGAAGRHMARNIRHQGHCKVR